jgi:hypothetical protein
MTQQEITHNGHETMPIPTELCPWCGGVISHVRFAEIEAKIRDQEETKLAEAGKQLRVALETQYAVQLDRNGSSMSSKRR